jgi:ABC-2 type transport system ATP-binding protein
VAVIDVHGLVKRYGKLVAVDGVSFSVEAGEVFALLGPNGAGKTTTVEILEGLRRRDGGDVRVLGADPDKDARRLAPKIGVMPQSGDLQAGIRTIEAVHLFAAFYDGAEDPAALMTKLGLDRVARTTYRRLSGGERRRLSLALALVGRPDVAFLDEPTSGMDVEGRGTTWELVRELCDRGVAIVLTTHLLDEAERVADRVGIVHRGRLVGLGSPSELAGASRGLTFSVERPIDADALASSLGVDVEQTRYGYRLDGTEPDPALIARLTAWLADKDVRLRRLDVGTRSLEDVYLELTK